VYQTKVSEFLWRGSAPRIGDGVDWRR